MPVLRGEIVKGLAVDAGLRTWRNVYHIDGPGAVDAMLALQLITDIEVNIHASTVSFLQLIVSDPTGAERRLTQNLTGVSGARTIAGDAIPIWNVVDVKWTFVSNHRPGFKYYRVILGEGDIVGTVLDASLVSDIQNQMVIMNDTIISLCAPNGDSVQNIDTQPNVGMRQPKWSRRWRKGFHRGYIPNA